MLITKIPTSKFTYAFIFNFNYEILNFCRAIKNKVGYQQFTFFEKKWSFNNLDIVEMIKNRFPEVIIDTAILPDIEKFKLEKQTLDLRIKKAEELKKATTSDLIINGLKKEPYPFQKVAIQFIENSAGRLILGSEMGTGKTIISLGYITLKKFKKILVITPASLKWNWYDEIIGWTKLKPLVISSTSIFTIEDYNQHDVIVVNYDILKKFHTILSSLRFDICLCDEGHMLKGDSQRFKLTKRITLKIPEIIIITGTFILNRSIDAFNLLNIIDPRTWNDWWYYSKKFCDGHNGLWGYDASGNSNTEELKQLISKYYFRQTKAEVLSQLPEKHFVDIPIDLPEDARKKYDFAINSFAEYLREVKKKNKDEIDRSMSAEALVRLGEIRQICSNGKIAATEEIIENIIDNGQKVLVFSCFNSPLEYLHNKFKDSSVILTGKTSELDKKKAVDDFQKKDNIKVFFGGILSSSVGLNLTAASNVIFQDFPWRPSDISQAYSRIDRIGQQAKHINIFQMVAKDTIDNKIQYLLQSKQDIINKLVQNEGFSGEKNINVIGDLLKMIETNKV